MSKACMKCGAEGANDRETCGSCGSEYAEAQSGSSEQETGLQPGENMPSPQSHAASMIDAVDNLHDHVTNSNADLHDHITAIGKHITAIGKKIEDSFESVLEAIGNAVAKNSNLGGDS